VGAECPVASAANTIDCIIRRESINNHEETQEGIENGGQVHDCRCSLRWSVLHMSATVEGKEMDWDVSKLGKGDWWCFRWMSRWMSRQVAMARKIMREGVKE